jgi:GT2 family glycosyltransferase
MHLSILIINWNTRDLLRQCLDSIYSKFDRERFEIIVVDNASTDGSPGMVRGQFPRVVLIENPANVGFARANNQAIQRSSGRYVLLLNSDTIVQPGALNSLLDFMEAHAEAGCVGARLLNPDGSLQYSCSPAPTLLREFLRLFHLPGVRPDGYYPMISWDLHQPHEVDVLLGACLLLRREALDHVGWLDESYFMYSEEVDLCYRLRNGGWRLFWVPQARIVHFGGQSTRQASTEMFLRLYEAKLIYFRKNHGKFKAQLYKLMIMLATLSRLLFTPLVWLEKPQRRKLHLAQAANYQRLLSRLPGM